MKTLKTGNPMIDDFLNVPASKKTFDSVNKEVLSKIYSDEEILELIELDKILNFERLVFIFGVFWNNDIFAEAGHLMIDDIQAWKRAQQLLGKEELNNFRVKAYDQEKLDELLEEARAGNELSRQAWREVMAFDLFKRMDRVNLFLLGGDSDDYKK